MPDKALKCFVGMQEDSRCNSEVSAEKAMFHIVALLPPSGTYLSLTNKFCIIRKPVSPEKGTSITDEGFVKFFCPETIQMKFLRSYTVRKNYISVTV